MIGKSRTNKLQTLSLWIICVISKHNIIMVVFTLCSFGFPNTDCLNGAFGSIQIQIAILYGKI